MHPTVAAITARVGNIADALGAGSGSMFATGATDS